MTDWTQGYVADIAYTYGYYPELNPLRLKLAFLNAGLVPPEVGTACELGFGQGISVNLHAAATVTTWHGTDFNPAHAAFAQNLAAQSGASVHLVDQAFDEFCTRQDLPEFDFIGLHGIWSWVSDENRRVIVDFIRRKLKVGGVLYISYNTQPGWAAMVPMQELLSAHADTMSADGSGILPRIDGALDFADRLLAVNPQFTQSNPQIAERLNHIKKQNRHYVAHEYFNNEWYPMSFRSVSEWLAPAKLSWACSANLMDAIDVVNLTKEQQVLLDDIPDPLFRQTVRDFCVNQQFRRDYWVKGRQPLSSLDQLEHLKALRLLLVQPSADVSLKVRGSLGEATLQASVYGEIVEGLSDHCIKTLGDLAASLEHKGVSFSQVVQGAMVFMAAGAVAMIPDDSEVLRAQSSTRRINERLINRARSHNEPSYLASPLTGGGVPVSRFHQLFLGEVHRGVEQPKLMAKALLTLLKSQGVRLLKENQPIETDKDMLKELERQASSFLADYLPIYRILQLA